MLISIIFKVEKMKIFYLKITFFPTFDFFEHLFICLWIKKILPYLIVYQAYFFTFHDDYLKIRKINEISREKFTFEKIILHLKAKKLNLKYDFIIIVSKKTNSKTVSFYCKLKIKKKLAEFFRTLCLFQKVQRIRKFQLLDEIIDIYLEFFKKFSIDHSNSNKNFHNWTYLHQDIEAQIC